jgi:hypothetical protein
MAAAVPDRPVVRPAPPIPSSAAGPVLLALGVAAAAGAAWLLLEGEGRAAGGVAALSGALLLVGPRVAGRDVSPLARFLSSAADRAFDGLVLTALAWALHAGAPRAAVLALVALGGSAFAAYARARGAGLGYAVEESALNRALRFALVAAGLLLQEVEPFLWALVVLTVLTAVVRSAMVVKGERAA